MKKILMAILFIATAALFLSCSSSESKKRSSADTSDKTETVKSTETAGPTFAVEDIDGKMHTYDEYKGKSPIVINFWGTWCPPCRAELPDLKKIYAEYSPKGITFVGLAVKDKPEQVRDFAAKNEMAWTMLIANQESLISFGITLGVPTTIFIDRNGNEQGRLIGMSTYEQFKEQIEKIL
jgi:thiol-disulfide isomerase/thioredoxin